MSSRAIRGHLTYPVAVIVAAGLVSAPINSGPAATPPRFVEFAAVRLQAEATTLIAGLPDGTAAKTAAALPGAAAAAAAAATSEPCYYPCTIFDKFLDSLPPEIRSILLPPLMTLAAVIGAVLAPVVLVTSLVFDWPYELGPAAASRPEDQAGPAEAGEPDDGAADIMQADPDAPAAVPGVPVTEVDSVPMVRGRGAERTAVDTPAQAAVPGSDAAQSAEPQTADLGPTESEVGEQNADSAVATEPQATATGPDDAEAVAADLTAVADEVEAASVADEVEAASVADEQHTQAATPSAHSATEAPATASSPRAAKRSTR